MLSLAGMQIDLSCAVSIQHTGIPRDRIDHVEDRIVDARLSGASSEATTITTCVPGDRLYRHLVCTRSDLREFVVSPVVSCCTLPSSKCGRRHTRSLQGYSGMSYWFRSFVKDVARDAGVGFQMKYQRWNECSRVNDNRA